MHKKHRVKEVIEKYIKMGRDFFELTPSFLEETEELKGFSERTLKRGRTEFKLEHPELMKDHSRNTASIKKKIFKHLDKSPDATPKELAILFPSVDKKVLTTTRKLWKKENSVEETKAGEKTIEKRVFAFLQQNPKASANKLEKAFPDIDKTTARGYLDQWKKDNPPQRKVSLKQKIMDYMNSNPGADLQHLREAFADTKAASINTYFSLWKNNRIQPLEPRPATNNHQVAFQSDDNDIIQALKTTIEAQKKTIEVLKSQNEILRERQDINFPELEGMTGDEVRTVERVISTFIRGIKSA